MLVPATDSLLPTRNLLDSFHRRHVFHEKTPKQVIPFFATPLRKVYATKVLQIMAEENKEAKIPQGQNSHGSAAIPPRMNQKTKWPEVVGLTVEEAERIIKEEKPGVQIQVIPPNYGCTDDYRVRRVRLHVDSSGKVHRPPIIG